MSEQMTDTARLEEIREQAARAMLPLYAPRYKTEAEIQRVLPYLKQLVDASGLLSTISGLEVERDAARNVIEVARYQLRHCEATMPHKGLTDAIIMCSRIIGDAG